MILVLGKVLFITNILKSRIHQPSPVFRISSHSPVDGVWCDLPPSVSKPSVVALGNTGQSIGLDEYSWLMAYCLTL